MFRREAALGSLLIHPNIVQVLDLGRHQGTVFLAMEFVDGMPLSSLLRRVYWKRLPPAVVAEQLVDFLAARDVQVKAGDPRLERVVMAFRERSKTLQEMADMAVRYFQHGVTLEEKAATKHLTAESKPLLTLVREQAAALPQWSAAALDEVVKKVSEQAGVGMGKVAQPVRVAATGGTVSPGIGETLELLGREETLHRLDAARARP